VLGPKVNVFDLFGFLVRGCITFLKPHFCACGGEVEDFLLERVSGALPAAKNLLWGF
jgi:hypothetical protein